MRRSARWAVYASLVAAAGLCAGCAEWFKPKPEARSQSYENLRLTNTATQGPPSAPVPTIDPTTVSTRDDITSIVQFWPTIPWIKDVATGRVNGFRATVYFISAGDELGAFVPGTIMARIFVLTPDARGNIQREQVYQWGLDEQAAMPFRIRKRATGGYYYGMVLKWPDELDLSGQQVEIAFSYIRGDGVEVKATPRSYRVPAAGRMRSPAAPTLPGRILN